MYVLSSATVPVQLNSTGDKNSTAMTSILKHKALLSDQIGKPHNNHKCIAPGCPSIGERRRVRYFRLPSDQQRRNQWLANCDRQDLKGHSEKSLYTKVMCQLHFHDSQFMNAHTYQRLIWNAVPTLFGKDVRRLEDFEPKEAAVRVDHAYTVPSPELPPASVALPPAPLAPAPPLADSLRHYVALCAELKSQLADKDRQLKALEKCSDGIVDGVIRHVKILPPEKQQQLVSALSPFVKLSQDEGRSKEPKVRVEVLLISRKHPGHTLLGLRTRCSWARGLYMVPGNFLHFGESWEAAAVRAAKEETGLDLVEPRVCSVVETVRASEGYHWINIFMVGKLADPAAEPAAPNEAVCTGWHWFAWDALPGEELLFWSLRDLRRENVLDLTAFQ
ncbi:uncharacterized protein LOC119387453 [Rhipicephalus sanguineus]|uniref:uncharacterized protein LOC119387453 n=1 Tax=Rhipicephalus sanguineus TaxID=34632 RepID=UPI001893DA9D|nr:uncharacterized protein LOC119387453 [Rhipicephalus sanguineus]